MVPDGCERWVARGISSGARTGTISRVTSGIRAWARRLEPFADPALAVAAFALSVLPLLQARDCGCDPAPTWAFVLVAVQCLPLAVRRRWPFGASLAVGVLSMAYGVANAAGPAGLLRDAGRAVHRRGARVASQGQRRGRYSRGRPVRRGPVGPDPLRLPGPGGQRGGVRHRLAARRQRAQPPRPGRRAGGASRAARADPRRRGRGRGRRRAQPHRTRAARRGRPPRQPDGGAGRGRPGGAGPRPAGGRGVVRLDQRGGQAGAGRDAPAARRAEVRRRDAHSRRSPESRSSPIWWRGSGRPAWTSSST